MGEKHNMRDAKDRVIKRLIRDNRMTPAAAEKQATESLNRIHRNNMGKK